MTMSIRPLSWGVLPSILACGLLFASAAWADGAMRPIRPEERSFLERMDAELAKALPPLPAGWQLAEQMSPGIHDMVPRWEPAPAQHSIEWRIVASDRAEREARWQARLQQQVDTRQPGADALEAARLRLNDEYLPKIEAAANRNDLKTLQRLQAEFEKKMTALQGTAPPLDATAPELIDTTASIRIEVNPYSHTNHARGKPFPKTAGIVYGARIEPEATDSPDKNGVTELLLGRWKSEAAGSQTVWTLQFTDNQTARAYGLVIRIEARPDRAEALRRAMNIGRLQALLK